jgi:hypothetical protein
MRNSRIAAVSKWNIWARWSFAVPHSVEADHGVVESFTGEGDSPLAVEHDDLLVVRRDHPRVHLPLGLGLDRVPGLGPRRAVLYDCFETHLAAAIRQGWCVVELDVRGIGGNERFGIPLLDGSERVQDHINVLTHLLLLSANAQRPSTVYVVRGRASLAAPS